MRLDVVILFVAFVPQLNPQVGQAGTPDVAVRVDDVDSPIVTVDEETAHKTFALSVFAAVVGRRRVVGLRPGVHPVAVAIHRHFGAGLEIFAPVIIGKMRRLSSTRLVVAAFRPLHPRVNGVAAFGSGLCKTAPVKPPISKVGSSLIFRLRSLFDRGTDDGFHGSVISRLWIVGVSLVAHIRSDDVEPIGIVGAEHWKHFVFVVVGIQNSGQTHLFEIGSAVNGFGLRFGFGQSGKEHAGQNGDDRNNHQKLDQCKTTLLSPPDRAKMLNPLKAAYCFG